MGQSRWRFHNIEPKFQCFQLTVTCARRSVGASFPADQLIRLKEALVRRVRTTSARWVVVAGVLAAAGWSWRVQGQGRTGGAVVYEGARLITGDGSAPIENSAFV